MRISKSSNALPYVRLALFCALAGLLLAACSPAGTSGETLPTTTPLPPSPTPPLPTVSPLGVALRLTDSDGVLVGRVIDGNALYLTADLSRPTTTAPRGDLCA